jgi:hypothetical protein
MRGRRPPQKAFALPLLCLLLVDNKKSIKLAGGLCHGAFISDGVSPVNRFGFVAHHFHCIAPGSPVAFEIADRRSAKIVGIRVPIFLISLSCGDLISVRRPASTRAVSHDLRDVLICFRSGETTKG